MPEGMFFCFKALLCHTLGEQKELSDRGKSTSYQGPEHVGGYGIGFKKSVLVNFLFQKVNYLS
jgi:hypothetical protein